MITIFTRHLPMAAALFIALAWATPSLAVRGPQNIANTPHNLSSSSPTLQYGSTNEEEICIFCHTPHGGSLDGPLWNKNPTTTTFTHYTSATLSTKVADSRGAENVFKESLLCLTCHDGSISMYNVINTSNRTGGQPEPGAFFGFDGKMPIFDASLQGAKTGAGRNADGTVSDVSHDLSDDHPISFFYEAVRNDSAKTNTQNLRTIGEVETAGARFFPQNGADADKRVECGSCHDPHVDYGFFGVGGDEAYAPFLITPNDGSKLCLACHIK